MPTLDWTRTAMPSSLLLSPEGFRIEPYKLKESCKEAPFLLYGLFVSLGHARLTAIKSASGHDIILVYTPCQNNFGPRKSNLCPLFFKNPIFFWIHKLVNLEMKLVLILIPMPLMLRMWLGQILKIAQRICSPRTVKFNLTGKKLYSAEFRKRK